MIPENKPAQAEPIILAYNGFFNFREIPYKAGSVIPATIPEIAAAYPVCFNSLFFVFNATANAAAPCEKLNPRKDIRKMESNPWVANRDMAIGEIAL